MSELKLNKSLYQYTEPIVVTASSDDPLAWVGIYLESDKPETDVAIFWYYVKDFNGTPINIRDAEHNPTRGDIHNIPENKYKVYMFANDGYEIIGECALRVAPYGTPMSSIVKTESLYKMADAIRTKSGKTEPLEFPDEMVEEVNALKTAPKITDFSYFCYREARLDLLDELDTSSGTNFSNMFATEYSAPKTLTTIPPIDTSNGNDFSNMFDDCSKLITIPQLDVSKGTNFTAMFSGCSALQNIPPLDTSSGTNFYMMFSSCSALQNIPPLDTSKVVEFRYAFSGCKSIVTIPELDTSSGSQFQYMFQNCTALQTIPDLDVSWGHNFSGMFKGCTSLKTVGNLKTTATHNPVSIAEMFKNCSSLETIEGLDFGNLNSKSTEISDVFYGCTNLTNLKIFNVRTGVTIGSGTSYGHLLTVESLVGIIQELVTPTSGTRRITIGSTNLAKLSGLYCKITDDTSEKLTMELCESTDEGAITLEDYWALKKWTIS